MATSSTKRDIPEAEAERQVIDSLERLDELRIEELKLVSEEQGWKMDVLRAEMERLEPTLTAEHPRLLRIKAQLEHYALSREAIGVLVSGTDDTGEPKPTGTWELSGIVRYQKLDSPAGLKVVLEPEDKNLETMEAECNADGFYRITLEAEPMQQYLNVPLILKVYYKTRRPIFTLEKPILVKAGKQRQDVSI